jgi:hypothetical protein
MRPSIVRWVRAWLYVRFFVKYELPVCGGSHRE